MNSILDETTVNCRFLKLNQQLMKNNHHLVMQHLSALCGAASDKRYSLGLIKLAAPFRRLPILLRGNQQKSALRTKGVHAAVHT